MCRKLGKGHPKYINRNDGLYTCGDDHIAVKRRAHNGRPINELHGHNALNAFTDLRDKLYSNFPDQKKDYLFKSNAKTVNRLKRLERSTNHGITRLNWPTRRAHLMRNNVCVVSYLRDKNQ